MASLLVVTGPPGAGKSTVAALLAHRAHPSVLVEGDAFFRFLARGAIAPWLPESSQQNEVVTRAAASAAGAYARGGYATVYDGIVGPWYLPTFSAAAAVDRLDYVVLLPPVERCLHGVRSRTGHGFSDEGATRKMHDDFTRVQIESRHVLSDLPARPSEVAALVTAALADDSLMYRP